jgi:hypothetical protein
MSQSYFLALTSDFNRSKALFSKGFTIIQQVLVTVEPSWGLWLAQQAELLLAHSPVLQVLSQHQQHRSVVQ